MEKTSAANEAVIKIREMRAYVEAHKDDLGASAYRRTAEPFLDALAFIEQELYQVKNQSNQDPLNFPIKLNNRLASLRRSIETGDARPTDGAYKVFRELSAELEKHLEHLDEVLSKEGGKVNRALIKAGMESLPTGMD